MHENQSLKSFLVHPNQTIKDFSSQKRLQQGTTHEIVGNFNKHCIGFDVSDAFIIGNPYFYQTTSNIQPKDFGVQRKE